MRFSLVVATCGRVQEMRDLLQSLRAQGVTDFEVLVIDQNADDRLSAVIEEFSQTLDIKWIRRELRNSSYARNAGLPLCQGEIIAFPDDDCIYPPTVLAQVDAAFRADPALGLLSGPAITAEGKLSSGRWEKESGGISIWNVWTTVIAFTLFVSAEALKRAGEFDELLGVNAKFGSCEETDLAIRVLRAGGKGYYHTGLRVIHPDKKLTAASLKRAFSYGEGMGYVLHKHRVNPRITAKFIIRPAGGVLLSLLKRNVLNARYYWHTLRGRVSGYRSGMRAGAQ